MIEWPFLNWMTIIKWPFCSELWNLTFLVKGKAEVLHTVKEKLEEIRAMLKGSIKTDENLLLEPQQTENRKRKINLKLHQLPQRTKKKPFTKRFVESRYIKEKAWNININEALDSKKYWEEIPELMLDEKDQEDKEESVPSNEHKPDAFKNVWTLDDRNISLILKGICLMTL